MRSKPTMASKSGSGRAAVFVLAASLLSLTFAPLIGASPAPLATLALPTISSAAGFLKESQNIAPTDYNSLSEIFFYLGARIALDGNLSRANATTQALLAARLRAMQNADGGYGDWAGDRSTTGATARALESLNTLGLAPSNTNATLAFLDALNVSSEGTENGGFRTSAVGRTPSLTSTGNAIRAYQALAAPIPNVAAVVAFVQNHQNTDGGFGLMSDRAGLFADVSTVVSTYDGVGALASLGAAPDFPASAISFLRGLQNSDGGFSHNAGNTTSRVAYTYDALDGLSTLGSNSTNPSGASSFVLANELPNGGFVENGLDLIPGVHTTYYALRALRILRTPFSDLAVSAYINRAIPGEDDGGFGNQPGVVSLVRFTFDLSFSLNSVGERPADRGAAVAYLLSLRNADGGFGSGGFSTADATARAVITLQALGAPVPTPTNATRFLRSLQNPDGGFGAIPGAPSTVTYTYRALTGLDALGAGPNSTTAAISFLRARQQTDGGF